MVARGGGGEGDDDGAATKAAWDAVNALPASAFVSRAAAARATAAGERASAGQAAEEVNTLKNPFQHPLNTPKRHFNTPAHPAAHPLESTLIPPNTFSTPPHSRDELQGDHCQRQGNNNNDNDNADNHSNDNGKKRRGRGGRGAKCCRSDKLSVDDFIAHLADGLGRASAPNRRLSGSAVSPS